jgi:hypothetical protein
MVAHAGNRKRGEDNYSYHGDALPRVIGALANHDRTEPFTKGGLANHAEVSVPTATKIVRELVKQTLVEEGHYASRPPHFVPAQEFFISPTFDEALESNPEWKRAAVIRGLMDRTGLAEGQILDAALNLFEQGLDTSRVPKSR